MAKPLRRVVCQEYTRWKRGTSEFLIDERYILYLECGHSVRSTPSHANRRRVRCEQCPSIE